MLAYLLPGLMAALIARHARGVRPQWYVTGAAILAGLLLFAYVTLEVRHAFQGDGIGFMRSTSSAEVWTYSAAWLVLGLVFLAYGIWRGSREARMASAALVLLSVAKVFLLDLSGLTGLVARAIVHQPRRGADRDRARLSEAGVREACGAGAGVTIPSPHFYGERVRVRGRRLLGACSCPSSQPSPRKNGEKEIQLPAA